MRELEIRGRVGEGFKRSSLLAAHGRRRRDEITKPCASISRHDAIFMSNYVLFTCVYITWFILHILWWLLAKLMPCNNRRKNELQDKPHPNDSFVSLVDNGDRHVRVYFGSLPVSTRRLMVISFQEVETERRSFKISGPKWAMGGAAAGGRRRPPRPTPSSGSPDFCGGRSTEPHFEQPNTAK